MEQSEFSAEDMNRETVRMQETWSRGVIREHVGEMKHSLEQLDRDWLIRKKVMDQLSDEQADEPYWREWISRTCKI